MTRNRHCSAGEKLFPGMKKGFNDRNSETGNKRMEMNERDRRKGNRIDCQFPAQLVLLFPDMPTNPFSALVLVSDVSSRGVRVLCPQPPKDFDLTQVREGLDARLFLHNGEERARITCRLVRVERNDRLYRNICLEIGLEFMGNKAEDRKAVERFLRRGKDTRLSDRIAATTPALDG